MAKTESKVAQRARVLTQQDLALLACSVCHSKLLLADPNDHLLPRILCTGCGREYPIVDGLAVLLAGRASHPEKGSS